jgi:hypothetical protein
MRKRLPAYRDLGAGVDQSQAENRDGRESGGRRGEWRCGARRGTGDLRFRIGDFKKGPERRSTVHGLKSQVASGCETEFFLLNGFSWDWEVLYLVG